MYAALWHALPGPWWVRVLILLVLIAAVLYGLFVYGFPWVSQLVNPQAAYAYQLEGADSHAIALAPAPTFTSLETSGEMEELYWMALARDVRFLDYAAAPPVIPDALQRLCARQPRPAMPHSRVFPIGCSRRLVVGVAASSASAYVARHAHRHRIRPRCRRSQGGPARVADR